MDVKKKVRKPGGSKERAGHCCRHDEVEMWEPKYLAVSFGVSNLVKTGVIADQYIDLIVACHVVERYAFSVHPIDTDKPCGSCGANIIEVISMYSGGYILLRLPGED
jgi:hypothetical protein